MPETSTILRVAIVGCGIIGRTHADALTARSDTTITALVDRDPTARSVLADSLSGLPAQYDDLGAALAGSAVDLVAICTPSGTHAALAELALGRRKHVVIEKPLDVDLPRARRLGAAATRAARDGVVSSVISQHRFDPASALVAESIAAGRFGRLTSAVASVAWWRSDEYYASAGWRGTWEQDGGGALMNQGVHTVDLLLWFLGRPVTVQAEAIRAAHPRIEVEDTVVATISFESGAVAALHATTAAYPGDHTRISVHGTAGGAEIENDVLSRCTLDGSPEPITVESAPPGGHVAQYDDILRAIATGGRPAVTVQDAIDALATVRSVYLASTLQRPVRFVDVLEGRYDDVDVSRGVGLPPR